MIKTNDGVDLYSPQIAMVIYASRMHFAPSDATFFATSDGEIFNATSRDVYYDRNKRGKSWFILDLRTT